MKKLLIAAIAAAAFTSGAAQAQGMPGALIGSSQPRPQWSQAERLANPGPVAWLQHLFNGESQSQVASRTPDQSKAPASQLD